MPSAALGLRVAYRYFIGKKSAAAITIITWVSILAIVVSSAAMIILLSVENGFDGLLKELYKVFYPELRISTREGKFFTLSDNQLKQIEQLDGIATINYSIEDMVMLEANEEQRFATVKGVDDNWVTVTGIDSYLLEGDNNLQVAPDFVPAILGSNLAATMGINTENPFSSLSVFYPNANASNPVLNPAAAFNTLLAKPKAVFKVQADFDEKYVIIPLQNAQQLFAQTGNISAVEIQLKKGYSEKKLQASLQKIVGLQLQVETRYQQNKTLWMILGGEKWAIYAILFFVLLLSSFNMIGALSLMVIEKKKDISILRSMGATTRMIRGIFLSQGFIMASVGATIGIVMGCLICLSQQYFGWKKLGGDFIIDAYPVQVRIGDVLLVLFTVLVVGLIAAWQPSMKAARQKISVREE